MVFLHNSILVFTFFDQSYLTYDIFVLPVIPYCEYSQWKPTQIYCPTLSKIVVNAVNRRLYTNVLKCFDSRNVLKIHFFVKVYAPLNPSYFKI